MKAIEISEDVLRQVAHILGDSSAAAQALKDAERRRQSGQQVRFFECGQALLVVDAAAPPHKE